mgnify:CR=1 FL=1
MGKSGRFKDRTKFTIVTALQGTKNVIISYASLSSHKIVWLKLENCNTDFQIFTCQGYRTSRVFVLCVTCMKWSLSEDIFHMMLYTVFQMSIHLLPWIYRGRMGP